MNFSFASVSSIDPVPEVPSYLVFKISQLKRKGGTPALLFMVVGKRCDHRSVWSLSMPPESDNRLACGTQLLRVWGLQKTLDNTTWLRQDQIGRAGAIATD